MSKFKIIYEREACIGAAACAALDPELFVMNDDGKADMKGAKKRDDGKWEIVIEARDEIIDAAQGCPVEIIKVYDENTGEEKV